MLRIKIIDTINERKKQISIVKIVCPSCKKETTKEMYFSDLWGQYSVKCLMCGGKLAPVYHILNFLETRVLWHKHDGKVKPQFGGEMWAPLAKVVIDE